MNALETSVNTDFAASDKGWQQRSSICGADRLPDALLERVLTRLGFNRLPEANLESLKTIYNAWCRCIPFDNVRKLIHIRRAASGPLPSFTVIDFFEGWLNYGTGGTCWAGAGASHVLLVSLGFDAVRVVGTMLVNPDVPPNHGSVMVRVGAQSLLFDSSILSGEPLLLDKDETMVNHPAWGVRCNRQDTKWQVTWRPLNGLDNFVCRLETFGVDRREFETRHEQTRAWSPFNYQLSARLNYGDEVIGVASGHMVIIHSDGSVTRLPHSDEERRRLLIERLGMAEEILMKLPMDVPTPPPPSTSTATRLTS